MLPFKRYRVQVRILEIVTTGDASDVHQQVSIDKSSFESDVLLCSPYLLQHGGAWIEPMLKAAIRECEFQALGKLWQDMQQNKEG